MKNKIQNFLKTIFYTLAVIGGGVDWKDTLEGTQCMGKKSEAHKDAKSRGVDSNDVSKLRQTEMKGTRGIQHVAGKFGEKDLACNFVKAK